MRTCIHVLKKPVTFADRSDMGCERKREVKTDFKALGLRNLKNGFATN